MGSSEVTILENTSTTVMTPENTFREILVVVKLEHRKSLVIVAGGDLSEIHPLLTLTQKWRNMEIGSSEVAIMGNTFQK